ncbi:hypothetical protein JCM19236_6115 [Vibrio sp. JCM 19236]|nr:hypothetical protein JCM19236_6115 [Vibrio sp. JCM 19236]
MTAEGSQDQKWLALFQVGQISPYLSGIEQTQSQPLPIVPLTVRAVVADNGLIEC